MQHFRELWLELKGDFGTIVFVCVIFALALFWPPPKKKMSQKRQNQTTDKETLTDEIP
jgi:hypothetical protein